MGVVLIVNSSRQKIEHIVSATFLKPCTERHKSGKRARKQTDSMDIFVSLLLAMGVMPSAPALTSPKSWSVIQNSKPN